MVGTTWKSRGMLAVVVASLVLVGAQEVEAAGSARRYFVHAENGQHERALQAIAGAGGMRHEFVSPGSELTFSAELTQGQVKAIERLGGSVEPVEEIFPSTSRRRYGRRHQVINPQAKPVCGDGVCAGNESSTCPQDCDDPPPPTGRTCEPQDQREHQTLLLSGTAAGASAGAGVKLLVLDTGTTVSHPDLDVTFCRNATGRRIKNNCADSQGHGTHTSGSAAAYGGDDGLGLYGAAPGVTLGFEKICTNQCFLDDMVRAIEDGTQNFHPQVMTLSFSASDTSAMKNAIDAAEADGTLFFASTSNDGPGANTIAFPAAYDNVVGVGSLDVNRIGVAMSGRGLDDGNDNVVSTREMELSGGGFVIESLATDGCYTVLSGTSMSTPSVAGFAAANWQGSAAATRAWLHGAGVEDVNNSSLAGLPAGYDDTTAGYDTSTGYGLPRTAAGINGSISAGVTASPSVIASEGDVSFVISGPANANFRIGISSPSGSWTFGDFTTDGNGDASLSLTTWADPGDWMVNVDFGGGASDFGGDWDTFLQNN